MPNECVFSPDRRYRYTLVHRWDELLDPGRGIAWIGLNPNTAIMRSCGILLRVMH
jgi:hypothetical protein